MINKSINLKQEKNLQTHYQDRGQAVVEYVLLLALSVVVAILITKFLINRSDDVNDSGILIKSWFKINQEIGKDQADGVK